MDTAKDNSVKISGSLKKFLSGKAFIYVTALFYFLMWTFKLELIGVSAAITFVCFILITQKDLTPVLPVIGFFTTGITMTQLPISFISDPRFSNAATTLGIAVCAVIISALIFSVIFHVIKFRKAYKNEKSEDKYKALAPFIVILCALALGGLFSDMPYHAATLSIAGMYAGLFLYFILCRHVKPVGGRTEYFATIALGLAITLMGEMIVFYCRQENFLDSLIYKSLLLKWGTTNSLAPFLVIAVPMALYMYIKTQKLPYMVLAHLCYAAVFLTVCRGEIFLLVLSTPVIVIITMLRSKKKIEPLAVTLAFLILYVILFFAFKEFFDSFFDRISYFSNSGRTPLRIKFNKIFSENFMFGIGFFIQEGERVTLIMPHMAFIKILAATGIVGFFAFMYFYWHLFKAVFINKSVYNLFLSVSLFLYIGYAFADPIFYNVQLHFIVYALLQGARRESDSAGRLKVWERLEELALSANIKAILVFAAGLLTAAAAVSIFALSGSEKFLFGNENYSYVFGTGLTVLSGLIIPPSAKRVYALIKSKLIKKNPV